MDYLIETESQKREENAIRKLLTLPDIFYNVIKLR